MAASVECGPCGREDVKSSGAPCAVASARALISTCSDTVAFGSNFEG
eukprot:SAG11_NODE_157_length_14147_cov_8.545202_15_plen_47_part_00